MDVPQCPVSADYQRCHLHIGHEGNHEVSWGPEKTDIKIGYLTLAGRESTAYVDEETGIGTDKYTNEQVRVALKWIEIAANPKGKE